MRRPTPWAMKIIRCNQCGMEMMTQRVSPEDYLVVHYNKRAFVAQCELGKSSSRPGITVKLTAENCPYFKRSADKAGV